MLSADGKQTSRSPPTAGVLTTADAAELPTNRFPSIIEEYGIRRHGEVGTMDVDVFFRLENLRCIEEHDGNGHSEPYIWTVGLWPGTRRLIDSFALDAAYGSRSVIKAGIKAGEQAKIPGEQRLIRIRVDDEEDADIGIVVVLWEWDDTPEETVRAAYEEFVSALPEEILAYSVKHGHLPRSDKEHEEVADAVRARARAAGEETLKWYHKVEIYAGTLDLDTEIGYRTVLLSNSEIRDHDFTLSFRKVTPIPYGGGTVANRYEIDGRVEVKAPPTPDPCQTYVDRVRRARGRYDALQRKIAVLQRELHGESGEDGEPARPKAEIVKEIRRIRREEVPPAAEELEAAQSALTQCRLRPKPVMIGTHLPFA